MTDEEAGTGTGTTAVPPVHSPAESGGVSGNEPPAIVTRSLGLADAVRGLRRASVAVIGDLMLDRIVHGIVDRISPDAPVPVIAVRRDVIVPGGAGNVVRNLTALGAAVALVAVVGDDVPGSDLTGLIGGQNGVEPWLLVQSGRVTTVKTRYVANGQQLFRADHEDAAPIQAKLAERMVRIARDTMTATSVTVLSDYGKGMFAGTVAPQLVAQAKSIGRQVIVASKGRQGEDTHVTFERWRGADVLCLNAADLRAATIANTATDDQVAAAAEVLRVACRLGAVLVTRAEAGLSLVDADGALHLRAEAAEVYDVSGAGDTVVAAFAAGLATGLPARIAARLANIAAGIVVGRAGTAVATEADLLAALTPQGGALRKIVGLPVATEQAERWRGRGLRVGLAAGSFDLLHPGHVHFLRSARALCDRLIVGLANDAAVARARGPGRPVQPEAARAAVLAGLTAVDLVCVDEDATGTLLGVRPDLFVTGGALGEEETELVAGWGGRCVRVDRLSGHSTTATVARLLG